MAKETEAGDGGGMIWGLCPVPDAAVGASLARMLVENRLAACVNLIPAMQSFYWWEGKVEQGTESLLLFKTTRERQAELAQKLTEAHPYEMPAIVLTEAQATGDPMLNWLYESCGMGRQAPPASKLRG